jgi:CHAT domain-containing protein
MQRYWQFVASIGFSLVMLIGIQPEGIAQIASGQTLSAQAITDRQAEADRLYQQGVAQSAKKQNDTAFQLLQQSLKIYQELNDRIGQMNAIRYLGWVNYQLKNYPQAREQFQQSLKIAQELNNRPGMVKSITGLGAVHAELKELDQAMANYEKAKTIALELKDLDLDALILEYMATAHRNAGNWQKEIDSLTSLLSIERELKQTQNEAYKLSQIGIAYSKLQKHQKSIEFHQQSLKIYTQLNSQINMAVALHNIGLSHNAQQGYSNAIDSLKSSLDLYRKLNNPASIARLLSDLGDVHRNLKEYQQSIEYHQQSLEIYQQLNDQRNVAEAFRQIGQIYRSQNKYDQAIVAFSQSLERYRKLDKSGLIAQLLTDLGEMHYNQFTQMNQSTVGQEKRSAAQIAWDALVKKKPNSKTKSAPRVGVKDHLDQAITYFAESIELTSKPEQRSLQSATFYRLIIAYADHPDGDTKDQASNYKKRAIAHFTTDLQTAEAKNNRSAMSSALYGLTMSYILNLDPYDVQRLADVMEKLSALQVQDNNFKSAEITLRFALGYDELFRVYLGYGESTRQGTMRDQDRIYLAERKTKKLQRLQFILAKQNRTNEALEISEESRARTFVELLDARVNSRPVGQELTPKLNIDTIRQIAKAQKSTLVQYSIVADDLLYIWVVKPTGEISFRSTTIDPTQPLKKLVLNSRSEIGVRGRVGIQKVAVKATPDQVVQNNLQKLHQLLIEPIAPDLPTDPNQQVIFLPQGELFLVPFAALPNAKGQHLIERHTLATAPSIQTLEFTQALAKRPKSQGNVLIVGDPKMPEFDGSPLESLPGARQEAIAIGKLLKTAPLLGDQATKSAVLSQMQSAKILHFATHGLLDTVEGHMPGAIALAPSGKDRGLLSSGEIFDLKLNADLVVLSACDTGRGQITGDGVVGLSRSFVAAGAPSVLVSLWAVDDGSTSELMGEFYRQLQIQPNKAQALRQAMLKARQYYPDPFHWAAFTLIGETQ